MKKILVLIFTLISFNTIAQHDITNDTKIGLVLSGGGAKGLAHIGALKTIDSLGIKIDYVAGTSMGAVIGSLYASGYSGKQLEILFNEVDFEELISDYVPRASKTFYERENSEKYAVTLPFDDFKIQLPSAISKGQNVFNLFSRLMIHVSDIDDFSKLPIPFFCIATNIETGEPVLLDRGSLPKAVAASGALPSLFQPVIIDDKLLIDGGVVNNYPVEELRAKGMDIIIGIDVQDGLADIEELNTAPGILIQINNFRTINAMKDKVGKTDIYIKPDIKEFNVVSFDEGKQIIENGKRAAEERLPELLQLVKPNNLRKPKEIKIVDSLKINNITISGNTTYTRAYVMGKLKLRGGEKVSYEAFNKGVNNLSATQNFQSFLYTFEPEKDGYNLYANVKESQQTTFLKLGLHYDDLYKSAALINLTAKRVLTKNDIISFDFIIGDNIRYNFDYFIDKGIYWSIGLRSRFNSFHKNIDATLLLENEEITTASLSKIDAELEDFTNQFFLQTLFRRDFALTLGAEHKRLKVTSETIIGEGPEEDETTFENSDFFSVFGQLKFDTYSNKHFPKSGFLFDGDFHWYISSSDFNNNFSPFSIAKAKIGYAVPFTNKFTAVIGSEGGFKIGEDSNNSLNFAIGGYGNDFINNFVPFYGYDFIAVTGNSFVKGSIDLDYEWYDNHHITLGANLGNIGDSIFEGGEWITTPDFTGYSLGYAIETLVGPLEVKYTWSPEANNDQLFFALGFWF